MKDKYCHLVEETAIYDGDSPTVDFKYVTSCCRYNFSDDNFELKDLKFCPICGKEINHEEDEYIPETRCKKCYRTVNGTQSGCQYSNNDYFCFYDYLKKQEEEKERKQYEELKRKFG